MQKRPSTANIVPDPSDEKGRKSQNSTDQRVITFPKKMNASAEQDHDLLQKIDASFERRNQAQGSAQKSAVDGPPERLLDPK